ncbi:hypothetical protein HYS48_00690 [Candidatus Woesearchaeota archaeon]|nr:hypothetical protein [Candidatus Woesearchaeota archaeon]
MQEVSYRSRHTAETMAKSEYDGISTTALEEAVLQPFEQGNVYLRKLEQAEQEMKGLEKRLGEVGMDTDSLQGKVIKFLHTTRLYTNQQRRRRQAKQVTREVQALEGRVREYEREMSEQQNAIERAVDLREKAGVLMERYEHTIAEMHEKIEELKAIYQQAKQEAVENPDSNQYLGIQNDISNIRLDIARLTAKRNRVAMKVVQYQSVVDYTERIKARLEALYQKCNDTVIRGEQALTYHKLIEDHEKLGASRTFQNILTTERGIMGLQQEAEKVDGVLLGIAKNIQGFQAEEWNGAKQEDLFQEEVRNGNDRYLQRAREILAKEAAH